MSCDTVVCDWNGTITRDRDERPILETIALDVFKTSIPFHPLRAARLLRARVELEKLYRQGRRDHEFDFIIEMFAIYNRKIIRGLPLSFIHRSVERYASRQDTQHKLDLRVLRPLRDCHSEGKTTGILSAGYGHGIDRILTVAGFRNCFDFREADSFRHEGGRATEFPLSIYRNKPRLLLNTLRSRNLDEDRRARLFSGIAKLIDREFGGTVGRSYLSVLYFARKRTR